MQFHKNLYTSIPNNRPSFRDDTAPFGLSVSHMTGEILTFRKTRIPIEETSQLFNRKN